MKPVFLTLGSLLMVCPALAHHGDAGRFEEDVTTLEGTVVALQLVNPHAVILMTVSADEGAPVRWHVEMEGPQRLVESFGWNRNTMKPGDRLLVTGRRVKSGAPHINLTERATIVNVESCEEIYHSRDLVEMPRQSECT